MFLAKVHISGFRCFNKIGFSFRPGFNAIVGRNNTGKTNLFNAIRHALGPSATRGDSLWLTEDDFHRDQSTGQRGERIIIEVIFDGLTADDRARFFELLDYNTAAPDKSTARVVFEASWPTSKRHPDTRRWGGASTGDRAAAPPEVLAQLPVTFLPALRDAEAALTPGNRSRLALLLQDLARRDKPSPAESIEAIFRDANTKLEQQQLVQSVRSTLRTSTGAMAGTDYAPCSITASPPKFERILRTLRVQMDDVPIEDISANGLGYNNLLYIATVLAHLEQIGTDETPLLLVEEPEAHLHPQLTVLLAEYLNTLTEKKKPPQVLVTTHSPTLAAHVSPSRISVTYIDPKDKAFRCNSLIDAAMSEIEERELRRMMDVTRATLYFAKGIILVEGVSEALLVPALARRIGCDILSRHISVIPICGVAFNTFNKILAENAIDIPVSIITDGDPPKTSTDWTTAEPQKDNGTFIRSPRTESLFTLFNNRANVRVFSSSVTLEYDLAVAGALNPTLMAAIWESCFSGTPKTFNKAILAAAGQKLDDQALALWRGVCVADTSGSKVELANKLADALSIVENPGKFKHSFHVPPYIRDAVKFVWDALEPRKPPEKAKTV